MRIAQSPSHLEAIANHPRVRPWIGPGNDVFACGDSWAWTHGVEWDDGGFVFVQLVPRIYSAHVLFLPKARDVPAKACAALRWLFRHTAAQLVIADPLRHTKHLCKAARMTRVDGYYISTARDWQEHHHGLGSGSGTRA